jgi:hypothetical protein
MTFCDGVSNQGMNSAKRLQCERTTAAEGPKWKRDCEGVQPSFEITLKHKIHRQILKITAFCLLLNQSLMLMIYVQFSTSRHF